MELAPVAALFVRADSIYKNLLGVDAWDEARNACAWPGGSPVVAHPPCGQWSRLRHFARPDDAQKMCGPAAVALVRECGGVLEHPAGSKLWEHCDIPPPGDGVDQWGGYSIQVDQLWWGHRCRKSSWLYIVGVPRDRVPLVTFNPAVMPTHQIGLSGLRADGTRKESLPEIPKSEREKTTPAFAHWLVTLARLATSHNRGYGK